MYNIIFSSMELQFLSFPYFFMPLSFLLFMSFTILFTARSRTANLPPGPWTLPLLGSIHHLVSSDPVYHRLRKLSQKHGPLMHLKLGERSTIVVSSPEVAKQVFKTHDAIFAQRPHSVSADIVLYNSSDVGFSPYGHHWRHLKKMCTLHLLSMKRVRSYQSIREAEVGKFVRDISTNSGCAINLGERIHSMIYAITTRAAFGDKCKDREGFVSIVKEIVKAATGFSVSDLFPSQKWLHVITGERRRLEEIHRKCDVILQRIVDEGLSRGTEDDEDEAGGLLHALLNMRDESGSRDSPLTINNAKAVILDTFVAGTETTASLIQYAMLELVRNPGLLERAQSEVREAFGEQARVLERDLDQLKFLKAVVKETMRLQPPLPLLVPRESSQCCEINGYTVPPRTQMLVNVWAMGRDSNLWDKAEEFRPQRFLNSPIDYRGFHFELIPFGAGKRICPGIAFGVANVELPLAHLLYYFDWQLPPAITSHRDLFVIPISRHHANLE